MRLYALSLDYSNLTYYNVSSSMNDRRIQVIKYAQDVFRWSTILRLSRRSVRWSNRGRHWSTYHFIDDSTVSAPQIDNSAIARIQVSESCKQMAQTTSYPSCTSHHSLSYSGVAWESATKVLHAEGKAEALDDLPQCNPLIIFKSTQTKAHRRESMRET